MHYTIYKLKLIISILLLTLLTCQFTYQAGVFIYWKINQAYITQVLCENRDKPAMHCNGKCYLEKQLNKANDNTANKDSFPLSVFKLKPVDNFIIRLCSPDFGDGYYSLRQKRVSAYIFIHILAGHLRSILRPPQFV